ncbi:hypothetical protein [Anaerotignum sp.]|uniref:hypothetical protein n=1 Tax=Anaerotignum sp. TaxID=2039241 RepID=UPI0027145530|nr:hypothetical protein [Anaerotignum sp.]
MFYIFSSEIFCFSNTLNTPSLMGAMVLLFSMGVQFRSLIPTKKDWHRALLGLFFVWIICKIIYFTIIATNYLRESNLGGVCFMLSWAVFCIFLGSMLSYCICKIFHKKPLQ